MTDFIRKTKSSAFEYRFAILWFVLFSSNALGSCIVASMAGAVWQNMGTQEKFTMIVAIFVNWTNSIMAFLSKNQDKVKQVIEPVVEDSNKNI